MLLTALSNAAVIILSAIILAAFLSDALQPQARAALEKLNWPLKQNYRLFRRLLVLDERRPLSRYGRFLPTQALLGGALLWAPDYWWTAPALLGLLFALAVITAWSENEDTRIAILRGQDRRRADDLADLRDEAVVAGFCLFLLVGLSSYRLSAGFSAFEGQTDLGPAPWIGYVADQLLSAITFGIPDALGWKGISGIQLSATNSGAIGEHLWVLIVRTMMSTLFVGTAAKMLEIRQTIAGTVKNFDREPEPVVRLGKRASALLDHFLSQPPPNHFEPTADELANDVVTALLRDAAGYDYPRSTRAIRALQRLRPQNALPIIQRKTCAYLCEAIRAYECDLKHLVPDSVFEADATTPAGRRLLFDGLPKPHYVPTMRHARSEGLLGSDKLISTDLIIDDVLASVECFTALLGDYVNRTGDIPDGKDGAWYVMPSTVFARHGDRIPFPDRRVRLAVARLPKVLSPSKRQNWQMTVLHQLAAVAANERDADVLSEILDALREARAPASALEPIIATLYGANEAIDALLRRYVLLSGQMRNAPAALVTDLLKEDGEAENAALLLQVNNDPQHLEAARDALQSDEKFVRERAARYIGLQKDAQSAPALIAALSNASIEPNDKIEFVNALVEIGTPEAVEALIDTVGKDMRMASEYAVYGLVKLRCRSAIPILLERLTRPIPDLSIDTVRLAADALGELKSTEAAGPLANLLVETLQLPAYVADHRALGLVGALLKIGSPDSMAALRAWRNAGEDWREPTLPGIHEVEKMLGIYESQFGNEGDTSL